MTEWLAFANDIKTFKVIDCFENLQECHWRKYSFSKGDIVYLYVKSVGRVLYKTIVVEDKVKADNWDDDKYWINSNENNDKGNRVVLRLLKQSDGAHLSFEHLNAHGLKTTQSLARPNKRPEPLMEYIAKLFNSDIEDEYIGESENPESIPADRRKTVYVNRYERDPEERRKCIDRYGNKYECIVCGFNFEEKYGEIGRGFIHVHHINPLSDNGKDVSENLIPVCPNCHAMLHRYLKEDTRDYRNLIKDIKNKSSKK